MKKIFNNNMMAIFFEPVRAKKDGECVMAGFVQENSG